MTALVAVPPSLEGQDWQSALEEVGQRLNVEVRVVAGQE
jgi:hypothetical protein